MDNLGFELNDESNLDFDSLPEMDEKLPAEKKEHLLQWMTFVINEDILRLRDWVAIYKIMLKACERERTESIEEFLKKRLGEES